MKIRKWVESSQEIEVDIGADDIKAALSEAFSAVIRERDFDERPTRFDVIRSLSYIGSFFTGLTDEHIAMMTPAQRKFTAEYLAAAATRFVVQDSERTSATA